MKRKPGHVLLCYVVMFNSYLYVNLKVLNGGGPPPCVARVRHGTLRWASIDRLQSQDLRPSSPCDVDYRVRIRCVEP